MIAAAPDEFDRACERWRELYQAALDDQAEQNRIVLDGSVRKQARTAAEGRRREAEGQLRLLRNEDTDRTHSDFYTYRYFASEGFLPGYSFPRLPLAAYIPGVRPTIGNRAGGDYLQRPRFLAISEFGPGAIIYHEGARYEIKRIQVPMNSGGIGTVDTQDAYRCESCGYHHVRRPGLDVCENCAAPLSAPQYGLMRMQTVFARRRERISSDEEERRRAGFELHTSYRFSEHGPRLGRSDAAVGDGEGGLMTVSYGDTATVRVTNVGRRRRKHPADLGYWLDTVKGNWLSERDAEDTTPQDESLDDAADVPTKQKVIPYVEDTRNILVVRLDTPVAEEVSTSLRYALERGIEAEFQLEDSELSSESLPDNDERGRMLFHRVGRGRRRCVAAAAHRTGRHSASRLCRVGDHAFQCRRHRSGSGGGSPRTMREGLLRLPAVLRQPDRPCRDRPACDSGTVVAARRKRRRSRQSTTSLAATRRQSSRRSVNPSLQRDFIDLLVQHEFALPDNVGQPVATGDGAPRLRVHCGRLCTGGLRRRGHPAGR